MPQTQKYYHRQSSFAGGLYSKNLWARDDLKRYSIGAKDMTNFYPYPYGGFTRRPGTRFIWECKNTSAIRLVSFKGDAWRQYVLEFGNNYIRVYRNGGIVLKSDGTPVEIWTPYSGDEIKYLKTVQAADRMYICDHNRPPMILSCYSDTSWTLTQYVPKRGPFLEQNTEDITVTPTLVSGDEYILTATSDIFTANCTGQQVKLSYNIPAQSHSWNRSSATTSAAFPCGSGWSYQVADTWSTEVTIQQSDDNGETWMDIKKWNMVEDTTAQFTSSGTVDHECLVRISYTEGGGTGSAVFTVDPFISDNYLTITNRESARKVKAKLYTNRSEYAFALPKTDATLYWSLGAWSYDNGFPASATFYQDRLFFSGTSSRPLAVWASQSGNYDDFGVHQTPEDSDGLSFSLVSGQVNRCWSFLSLGSLLGFTPVSEWKITAGASGTAITPSNIYAVQQTSEGSWDGIDPLVINNRAIFVTADCQHVRDIAYDYSTDSFRGNDLTLYNRDLFERKAIIAWDYQLSPDSIVWICQSDGTLLSFTYVQDQEVMSWARHTTDGKFLSVAVAINTANNSNYEAYFIVERTINGTTKRYIESIRAEEPNVTLPKYVDSYLTYSGKSVTTLSGLSHLEGKNVCVVADGSSLGLIKVSGGKITLDDAASNIVIGLPYSSTFETLDIAVPRQDGTSYSRLKKLDEIVIQFKESKSGLVGINTTITEDMEQIIMPVPTGIGVPSALYTGFYRAEPMGGYENEAHISITQDEPFPMTVLAIVAGVTMG